MTLYCVQFYGKRWCVRPEMWARPSQEVTYYLRAVRIADYLNERAHRVQRSSARIAA